MECCFVCGGVGFCQSVHVTKPNNSPASEPFFPFLERHTAPQAARPITADGTVRVCSVCYAYLLRQWCDNEDRGVSPLRRMYFLKRLDGGLFSGVDPNAPPDLMTHLTSGGISGELQQDARTISSPAQVIAHNSGGPDCLPSEHHIRCFICRNPCLKWNAKTAYSSQVLDNKEFYPFLEQISATEAVIPLTNGATKICVSCETELTRQWDHYEAASTPQEFRVYRLSIGQPPSLRSFANARHNRPVNYSGAKAPTTATPGGHRCALCPTPITERNAISWLPLAGKMHFPFLASMQFPAGSVCDRDRYEVHVCESCLSDLSTQWARHESARIAPHLRKYQLRSQQEVANKVPPSPVTNGSIGPIIAQCHVCLIALRDPHTLKTLRSKSDSNASSPFFPFLTKVRPATALSSTFPACDHCYFNLVGQWKRLQRSGEPVATRRYTYLEYVCSSCDCLRAQKEDVKIYHEKIFCTDCAKKHCDDRIRSSASVSNSSASTGQPHPSLGGSTNGHKPSTSRPSFAPLGQSSQQNSSGRTTVIVPPMLQHHQQHTGQTSIAGHHSGTSVSQSAVATHQAAASAQQQAAAAAAAAGYAEALRQLAKQVSTDGTDGPSAFRADTQAVKKQPVAAVAPISRLASQEPANHLNRQMQAYLASLSGAPQQGWPAAAEMEQQLAFYNSIYRASMLQQAYYPTTRHPGPLYPATTAASFPFGIPGQPPQQQQQPTPQQQSQQQQLANEAAAAGMMDPGGMMAAATLAWQQRLLAAELSSRQGGQVAGGWPGGWPPGSEHMMAQYLPSFMGQLQAQQQQAQQQHQAQLQHTATTQHQSSFLQPHKSPSTTPHQTRPLHRSVTPVTRPPPTSSSTPSSSTGRHHSASSSSQHHHKGTASNSHGQHIVNSKTPSVSSQSRSSSSGLNLSRSAAVTHESPSPATGRDLGFSISGLIRPSPAGTTSSTAPPSHTNNDVNRIPTELPPPLIASEEPDLVLDLSKSAGQQPPLQHRVETASARPAGKLYRPFEVEEEPKATRSSRGEVRLPASTTNGQAPPALLPDKCGTLSVVEEHFRRSLAAAQLDSQLSSSTFRRSKIDVTMATGRPLHTEKLLTGLSRRHRPQHREHMIRSKRRYLENVGLLSGRGAEGMASQLVLLGGGEADGRQRRRRRKGASNHDVWRRFKRCASDCLELELVKLVPVRSKGEFENARNLMKIFHKFKVAPSKRVKSS